MTLGTLMSAPANEELFEDAKSRPPWWRRRRRWLVYILIVALAAGGEYAGSRAVRAKLVGLVARKLDAQLEIGTLIYVPPYGASAWSVRMTRGGQEILSLPSATLRLAKLPLGGSPIVVSRFWIDKPALTLGPDTFKGVMKPGGRELTPKKLSDMLRLRELHLTGARVTWLGGNKHADAPAVWDRLDLDADLQQQAPSKYNIHVMSKASATADASATGTIDVDDLLLEIDNLVLKVRVEPEPARSPLPASVQQFLKQYKVTGSMSLAGSATVPLKDAANSACQMKITLDDGAALIPPEADMLDHARASLTVKKPADGSPVQVKIERIDVAGGGKTMLVDAGSASLDTAAGTWKLEGVTGHVAFEQPDAPTSAPTAIAPAPNLSTTRRRPQVGNPIDKFEPEGRIDFTATAAGPFDLRGKNPWQEIRHEVIAYPRGFALKPKNFPRPVEDIDGGEVRLVNGTIIFQELRGKYADDDLRLRGARLPVEGLPKLERWQEISGVITFHPPLRNYSPKLDKILDRLNPSGPFLIAGSYTCDRTNPSTEPKRTYDLIISSDTGALTLTPRKITFSKIRGDATITSAGVDIERAAAEVLGGTVHVSGAWRHDAPDAQSSLYQGEATFKDVDLTRLEEQLRDDPPSRPMQGRLFIEGSFGGVVKRDSNAGDNLKALQSGGQFEIVQGSLFQLPVVKNVAGELKGLKQAATVGDAAARFQIDDGQVKLSDVAINSPVLGLQGDGTVGLLERNPLNLDVVAAPLADWRDKLKETRIPILSDVASEVAGGIQKLLNTATGTLLYQFRIGGDLKDVQVTAVPTPVLTDTAATVFGRMLNPKKDEHPLDLIRRDDAKPAK